MTKRLSFLIAIMMLSSASAIAEPRSTLAYRYYPVGGDTAAAIHSSMLQRGPRVSGVNAYATTLASSSQSGQLVKRGQFCAVEGYRVKIDFVMNLPRLRNEHALIGQDKANWSSFSAFLKRHETQHTRIWLGCANELERKVRALRMKDCSSVDRAANALWSSMRTSCERKHAAFDLAEQQTLLRQSLIRKALGGQVARKARPIKHRNKMPAVAITPPAKTSLVESLFKP